MSGTAVHARSTVQQTLDHHMVEPSSLTLVPAHVEDRSSKEFTTVVIALDVNRLTFSDLEGNETVCDVATKLGRHSSLSSPLDDLTNLLFEAGFSDAKDPRDARRGLVALLRFPRGASVIKLTKDHCRPGYQHSVPFIRTEILELAA